jgi:hypothetical protein
MDGSGTGLYQMTGFGMIDVESSGLAIRELVISYATETTDGMTLRLLVGIRLNIQSFQYKL